MDTLGNALALWVHKPTQNDIQSNEGAWSSANHTLWSSYYETSTGWHAAIQVTTSQARFNEINVVTDNNGIIIAAWSEEENEGLFGNNGQKQSNLPAFYPAQAGNLQ